MNDMLKRLWRTLFTAVIWVFIFSINISGRSLFSYANETLVQNSLVRLIDQELTELFHKVYIATRQALRGDEDKKNTVF